MWEIPGSGRHYVVMTCCVPYGPVQSLGQLSNDRHGQMYMYRYYRITSNGCSVPRIIRGTHTVFRQINALSAEAENEPLSLSYLNETDSAYP